MSIGVTLFVRMRYNSCMNEKTVFIYVLKESGNDEVRYVGKTESPKARFGQHHRPYDDSAKDKWIDRVYERGNIVEMEIIDECPEGQWREREHKWIEHYHNAGHRLTNGACGIETWGRVQQQKERDEKRMRRLYERMGWKKKLDTQ